MFDRALQPLLRRGYEAPARKLVAAGVSADALTLTGFAFGLGGAACTALHAFWMALLCLLVSRILDGLDGAVARLVGPTERGAFLDIALDFVVYASLPFGFALADPAANALPAAALLFGFMGTSSSFLAFAAVAGRRGLDVGRLPHKGIHYLGGLTEGAETIAFLALMCLMPSRFPVLAWIFAALCAVTTCTRLAWGWRAFSTSSPDGQSRLP